jgi:hypothetical protein
MLLHNRIYDGLYEVDLTLQTPSTKNKENKLKDKHYPMGTRVNVKSFRASIVFILLSTLGLGLYQGSTRLKRTLY